MAWRCVMARCRAGCSPNIPSTPSPMAWTAPARADLFDRRIPEWRKDNLYLRYAVSIPLEEIRDAHAACKTELLAEIERRTGEVLDPSVMTIGFARRATPYK